MGGGGEREKRRGEREGERVSTCSVFDFIQDRLQGDGRTIIRGRRSRRLQKYADTSAISQTTAVSQHSVQRAQQLLHRRIVKAIRGFGSFIRQELQIAIKNKAFLGQVLPKFQLIHLLVQILDRSSLISMETIDELLHFITTLHSVITFSIVQECFLLTSCIFCTFLLSRNECHTNKRGMYTLVVSRAFRN